MKERRFARPVGSDESRNHAVFQREVHFVQRLQSAESLADAAQLQQGHLTAPASVVAARCPAAEISSSESRSNQKPSAHTSPAQTEPESGSRKNRPTTE